MKAQFLATMVLAALSLPSMAADVGVSISVGDPGFYGRIDINQAPRPRLIYAEPIVVDRVRVIQQPVYLHVPPGHAKKWDKHCGRYQACNRPVYFVEDSWYEEVYAPDYRRRHSSPGPSGGHPHRHDDHGKGNGKGQGQGRGKDRD